MKGGVLLGSHYDGDCGLLKNEIAESALDYIEAFTPSPDTDMTLAEAREAWPDKILWFNFPSSVHLKSEEEVEALTISLIDSLPGTEKVILAITEDVPADRWQGNFLAIQRGLKKAAAIPLRQ